MIARWMTLAGLVAAVLASGASLALAAPGDAERGEEIYAKRCILCHGEEGDADSPAYDRLNPPPRDFSEGLYKFKTTGFDDLVPNDGDLFRMIRDGMPGTAMPDWGDLLDEQDMWDLVAYIKTFAGLEEEEPSQQVDYGSQVASSAESIAAGKKLFLDRCAECHGDDGKGGAVKKLKDDAGNRTWPRNLTKPWTFRASNDPKDVYTRASVGIPGTQMPSFADPKSKKKLSIEERWHVANFVASLAKTEQVPRAENTVVKATKAEDDVPTSPADPRWAEAEPTTYLLLPQIIAKDRLFTPTNDTITVRAIYDDSEIALLLEWDDRTKSIPGDAKAGKLAEGELREDRLSVQFPLAIPEGMEKPYFGMGDASHPVTLWQWRSGTTDKPESVSLHTGRGFREIEEGDAASLGLRGTGRYQKGTWRVVIKRPLSTAEPEAHLQFEEGRFIPVAFAVWDGSNGEAGSKHVMSTWYWLLLKPPSSSRPLIVAFAVVVVLGAGEVWWARGAAKRKPATEG